MRRIRRGRKRNEQYGERGSRTEGNTCRCSHASILEQSIHRARREGPNPENVLHSGASSTLVHLPAAGSSPCDV
ncbi:hypothetical protein ANTPLA_LOCUS3736 [Anthophora plagiata]